MHVDDSEGDAAELRVRSFAGCRPRHAGGGGVRPEKVRIGTTAHRPATIGCTAGSRRSPISVMSRSTMRVPDGSLIEAQLTNRARRAAARMTWGDEAWGGWNSGRCRRPPPRVKCCSARRCLRQHLAPGVVPLPACRCSGWPVFGCRS